MKIFLTGATGFIGSAIVPELLAAGHTVLGLARSDASAEALTKAGAQVHRGELADTASLVAGAEVCDGVIHTGFIHDFSQYAASIQTDLRAVGAMLGALAGTDKPFVATSVTALLAPGHFGSEHDAPASGSAGSMRAAAEERVLAAASRGVRAIAVRLPPSVHGAGDYGFVPALIATARRTGVAAYVGDGANRWPAVHRLDAARVFRLALEKALPGTVLHAVAEEGIAMRAISEVIALGLGVPARSIAAQDAAAHFTWLAKFAAMDNPAHSELTRHGLGWQPRQTGLLDDMRESGYFA